MHFAGTAVRSRSRSIRVALLGPYHSPNLGDTAIQMAVIDNLRRRRPDIEICGVSLDARDTASSLGIPAFPISGLGFRATRPELHAGYIEPSGSRWPAFLPRQLKPSARIARSLMRIALQPGALLRIGRFLGSIDVLIVSGGGQLDDFHGGTWAHPYLLQAWVGLARLRGVRVAIVGVGLDHLRTPLSRAFVRNALGLAHYRSFRDAGTLERLRSIGWRGESRLCPDLAFSLRLRAAAVASAQDTFAVLSPVSEHTWSRRDDPRHGRYLDELAAAAVWLHQRALPIRIVCSQFVMDRAAASRLASLLRAQGVADVELCQVATVAQFLGAVRQARIVIASRLHAAILSLLAGTPVVAVAPLRKVSQLMRDAGLADYCIELQGVSRDTLLPPVARALEHQAELRSCIADYVHRSRSALAHTYDDLSRLMDDACP